MKETLKKLVELQGIDSEKLDLKYKRQEVLNSLVADKEEYKSLERRVAEEKQRQQSIREEGQRLVREQAQLEARDSELRKRLDIVRNTAESQAVGREIVANENKLQEHFEKVDRQHSDLEESLQRLAALQSQFFTKRAELADKMPGIKQTLAAMDKEIEKVDAKRKSLCSGIPQAVMQQYTDLIRTRAPYMVVEVQTTGDGDHTCSGCNIGLPPQVIGDIMKGDQLVCCENCGRILYLAEKEEK
ncbi:hypothetical protein J5754_05225 [bacterium]|nr:hypothetical protein [bacterium]